MCYRLLRKFLFHMEPEAAHHFTLKWLPYRYPAWFTRLFHARKNKKTAVNLMGLSFPNRVGLAAGFDKDGRAADALFGLGFGFVELGTVTPKPQVGNPKPRLFRIPEKEAVINRMGFNNEGVDALIARLKNRKVSGILGVNIGKNRDTPLNQAVEDYLICLNKIYGYADYVTINISSPNTPGLRDLQTKTYLSDLLHTLVAKRNQLAQHYQREIPLFVKISSDMTYKQLSKLAETLLQERIDGVICSNTTIDHSAVVDCPHGNEQGGLSGAPLFQQARQRIALLAELLEGKVPIIAVGGIMTVEDAQAMLAAGASLVQVYTGLIYQGPALVQSIAHAL